MFSIKHVLAIPLILFVGSAFSQTYMGQKVVNMPFPIAGGKILMLPVTDGGPIPAQNDKIKIQVAGFHVGPRKDNKKIPELTWVFGFTSKNDQKIKKVSIEEIASDDPTIQPIHDDTPQLKDNDWSASTESIEVNSRTLPWLYSSKPSIFVFKFAIAMEGEPEIVLYQPTWFPAKVKALFIADGDDIRR